MRIIYIHGANATSVSFNYIRSQLAYNDHVVEYNSNDGFTSNLIRIHQEIKDFTDVFFIGHSLGGIYALHLADLMPAAVLGAVTLSTPYGGSEIADFVKYLLPFSKLLRDIGPASKPMQTTRDTKVQHPWLNIVTIKGDSPWMARQNDGVVSLSSMRCRTDMELVELPVNHYEVLLSPATVDIIKSRLP